MKDLFIVANWKSNKLKQDIIDWFEKIAKHSDYQTLGKKVIICPSFIHIPFVEEQIRQHKLPFYVGAQNLSPFDEGSYTGEVNGKQIQELASHVIIGHSERRTEFNENDEMLSQKVEQAKKAGLTPIFCVRGTDDVVPLGVTIVAYEPLGAIGTGQADTPENAEAVAKEIKSKYQLQYVLYGGSVNSLNVKTFTTMENINGVLVGGASLDPLEFTALISNA